jgi:hypothetical protein
VALKRLQADAHICGAQRLWQIRQELVARAPALGQRFVETLALAPEPGWVIMEHVEGPTLLDVLHRVLIRPWADRAATEELLTQVGGLLAGLCRFSGASLGVPGPRHPNARYVSGARVLWRDPLLRRYLPEECTELRARWSRLPAEFAMHRGDRLLLVDCQPKNIVLDPRCGPRFIDLDYSSGHPGLMLAQFLVALDRLALRFFSADAAQRIEAWKQCFVAGYARAEADGAAAGPPVTPDLEFFYPWKLLRILQQHCRQRPWLQPYLLWTYRRPLRRFLAQAAAPAATPAAHRAAA